jgi:ABC-type glycerol-3-phosphate transport system permease component
MHGYGLSNNLWAVIAAQVTFATPFAILILQLYARLMPAVARYLGERYRSPKGTVC